MDKCEIIEEIVDAEYPFIEAFDKELGKYVGFDIDAYFEHEVDFLLSLKDDRICRALLRTIHVAEAQVEDDPQFVIPVAHFLLLIPELFAAPIHGCWVDEVFPVFIIHYLVGILLDGVFGKSFLGEAYNCG